jgi:hypothetical protein
MDCLLPSLLDLLRLRRMPAPGDWLAARVGPPTRERGAALARCRAELDWAAVDGSALVASLGMADPGPMRRGPALWEAARLPHEAAAARLLNVWGHLHPMEWRIRELILRLRAQRSNEHEGDWAERAAGTLADLQWYRGERCRLWRAWLAAAADYAAEAGRIGRREQSGCAPRPSA